MNVLVVEDHKIVRDLLCTLLATEQDVEVVTGAENGQQALQLLNNGLQADVVVTDINMPVMNGLELTRKLTMLRPDIEVIILTYVPKSVACKSALAAGAKHCLSKDGGLDELLAALRSVHA
jgi:DNA-binding NarL/FixJ family response regulator